MKVYEMLNGLSKEDVKTYAMVISTLTLDNTSEMTQVLEIVRDACNNLKGFQDEDMVIFHFLYYSLHIDTLMEDIVPDWKEKREELRQKFKQSFEASSAILDAIAQEEEDAESCD